MGKLPINRFYGLERQAGFHAYDLVAGPTNPFNAFNRERMENNELDQDGGNDIRSILIADGEVIIGSVAGMGLRRKSCDDFRY